MAKMTIIEQIQEMYPEVMIMDGYDDCIIGVARRFDMEPIVAYDYDKIIAKLVKSGMTEQEAIEFFEFNQIGAWMGELTPTFVERFDEAAPA